MTTSPSVEALTKPARSAQRLLQLDGLRGIAALAVVLFHFTYRYDELIVPRDGVWYRFALGEFGVALFFMLSGFVIAMSLERTRTPVQFAVARWWRLYPAFWAALLLTLVVTRAMELPGTQLSAGEVLFNLTMLPRLFGAQYVDGVYWSLQVELLFYLGIGLLWFTPARRAIEPIVALWIVLGIVAHFLLADQHFAAERWYPAAHKLGTLFNLAFIHVFAIGLGLYAYWAHGRRSGWALIALALAAHLLEHGIFELAILTALTLLLVLAVWGYLPFLAWRPLLVLGAISYPLYLVHQNVGYCLLRALGKQGIDANGSIAIALVIVLALAWLLSRFVEQPTMHWRRDRLAAKRPRAQVSLAGTTGAAGDAATASG